MDFPERTRQGKWINDTVIGTENRCERLEENSLGKRRLQIDPEGGQSPKWTVWQEKKKIPMLSDKYPLTHDFIQMHFKIIISSSDDLQYKATILTAFVLLFSIKGMPQYNLSPHKNYNF